MRSNLPAQTHDKASFDRRIWKLGPVTLDPKAWHWFRYILVHHLLKHKDFLYDEIAAHQITANGKKTLHKVQHLILHIDPLFHQDIEPQEFNTEMNQLNFDESSGDRGITNCMIQAEGPKSEKFLHQVFGILRQHEIQPKAW